MIRVTIDNLVARREGDSVLDRVAFELEPGALACLLGPSGAGKTALARALAGLDPIDGGAIRFDGRPIESLAPEERRIGLVFADDALWPALSIAENVGYPLKVRGVARAERRARVADRLARHGLDGLADRFPGELSALPRRRVALARALIGGPELLILDEPMARLTPRERVEFRAELRRVHVESRMTTLVLTDDPGEALALADRLALIDLGRIIQTGTPEEIYNRPHNAFVARLLGPVNLIAGHFETTDTRGGLVVKTPIGRLIGRARPEPLAASTPVTLAIRPESLTIGAMVPTGSNRFPATVERIDFLGAVREIRLRGPSDAPILALAWQGQARSCRAGQSVTVSVPPDLVVVLDRAGDEPS